MTFLSVAKLPGLSTSYIMVQKIKHHRWGSGVVTVLFLNIFIYGSGDLGSVV